MESLNDDDQSSRDLVFGDVGGWISGPSLDAERLPGPGFGLNITAWMRAYPGYVLQGGFDGFGFVCWRRSADGRKSGEPMTAMTLDDLAGLVDHREAHAGKPPDRPADRSADKPAARSADKPAGG
jgi:hypothetical protein